MMFNPPDPRDMLRTEVMEQLGLTTAEFAQQIGATEQDLRAVIACKAPISQELAIALERSGHSTARTWLAMQETYKQTNQTNAETAQAILDAREGRTTRTTIDDILENIDRE